METLKRAREIECLPTQGTRPTRGTQTLNRGGVPNLLRDSGRSLLRLNRWSWVRLKSRLQCWRGIVDHGDNEDGSTSKRQQYSGNYSTRRDLAQRYSKEGQIGSSAGYEKAQIERSSVWSNQCAADEAQNKSPVIMYDPALVERSWSVEAGFEEKVCLYVMMK